MAIHHVSSSWQLQTMLQLTFSHTCPCKLALLFLWNRFLGVGFRSQGEYVFLILIDVTRLPSKKTEHFTTEHFTTPPHPHWQQV